MPRSVQQPLPPMEVDRVHGDDAPRDPAVHEVHRLTEIPLHMSKAMVGAAVKKTLRVTGTGMKELGHKGLVHEWTTGEKNPNVAVLCQDPERRRAFALALLEDDDAVDVKVVVTFPATKVS